MAVEKSRNFSKTTQRIRAERSRVPEGPNLVTDILKLNRSYKFYAFKRANRLLCLSCLMTDIELLMIPQLVSKDRGSFDSQKYQQNLVERDISKETWLLPERKFCKAQNNKKIEWHGIIGKGFLCCSSVAINASKYNPCDCSLLL